MNTQFKGLPAIKIDISGAAGMGKTALGIVIAKALAQTFEDHGLLIPISVLNADGDWPRRSLDSTEDLVASFSHRDPLWRLGRVLITDLNGVPGSPLSSAETTGAALAEAAVNTLDEHRKATAYLGSALPESYDFDPHPLAQTCALDDLAVSGMLSIIAEAEASLVPGKPTTDGPASINEEEPASPSLTGTPPRQLTAHQVSPLDDALAIHVLDERGAGNANHEYFVTGMTHINPIPPSVDEIKVNGVGMRVCFQNGPIKEAGVNGLSNEVLLAIVDDRLDGFQSGEYACEDNAEAKRHIEAALECLQRRTKRRLARGVEGTSAL